jgi:hypothetical protein
MFYWITSLFKDNYNSNLKDEILNNLIILNDINNNGDEIICNGHTILGTLKNNLFENHKLNVHYSELIDCGDLIIGLYNFSNLTQTFINHNNIIKFEHSFDYNFKYIVIKYHNMIINNAIIYEPDIDTNKIEFNTLMLKFDNNNLIISDRTLYETHFTISHSHPNINNLYNIIIDFLEQAKLQD